MPSSYEQPALYGDRWITCTQQELLIRGYYFPWGPPKRIAYRDIRGVTLVQLSALTGKYRIWGTSDFSYWAHLDPGRPSKQAGLMIDLGRAIRPFITPDDPEQVKRIIERGMVGGL